MTTLDQLLAAIIDNPADDGLRLVYADRLEEEGQEDRAEFIRVQLRLATYNTDPKQRLTGGPASGWGVEEMPPEYTTLKRRERELFDAAQPWPLLTGVTFFDAEWRFSRGFIEEVHCTLADWLKHGPAIVRAQPVTKVVVTDKQAGWDGQLWRKSFVVTRYMNLDEVIDDAIFMFLPGMLDSNQVYVPGTVQAGTLALSAACLTWAKGVRP
jgi:uncharacterized protein (TIGR02996 family)